MKYLLFVSAITCYTYIIDAEGNILCGGSAPGNVTLEDCPGGVDVIEGPEPCTLSEDASLHTTEQVPMFRWNGVAVIPRHPTAVNSDVAPIRRERRQRKWREALKEWREAIILKSVEEDAFTTDEITTLRQRALQLKPPPAPIPK